MPHRRLRRRSRGARRVLDAEPEVLAHNLETVERLQPTVRDRRATYKQSLVDSRAREAQRQSALYEDVADARLRRNRRPRSNTRWTTRARPGSTSSRWGSTCSRPNVISRSVEFVTPEKFERLRDLGSRKASAKSSRARSRAAPTTPNKPSAKRESSRSPPSSTSSG